MTEKIEIDGLSGPIYKETIDGVVSFYAPEDDDVARVEESYAGAAKRLFLYNDWLFHYIGEDADELFDQIGDAFPVLDDEASGYTLLQETKYGDYFGAEVPKETSEGVLCAIRDYFGAKIAEKYIPKEE